MAIDQTAVQAIAQLLRGTRWVALATVDDDGKPLASQVALVVDDDLAGGLLHLSRLAAHTRHLLARPAASLSLGEPDDRRSDPQTLARVTLDGVVTVVERDSAAWRSGRARYLERLPEAAQWFGFADFVLLRFTVERARYVGGFANAHTLSATALRRIGKSP